MATNYRQYIEKLQLGEEVQFRPRGSSMKPKINSGQLITVSPIDPSIIKKGDIVLCKVAGNHYVHLVTAVQGKRFQISNNKGHINGWCGYNCIYGKVTKVEK